MAHLLITARLHDRRYHGAGEWPPSPARLFQALVAGAGLGGPRSLEPFEPALRWLEALDPPVVASPAVVNGQSVGLYVPDNDLDRVGGDPRCVGKIRSSRKTFRPRLITAGEALLYAWGVPEAADDPGHANDITRLAESLYQLGRGVDMAWAWGEILDDDALDARLEAHRGPIHRPSPGGEGVAVACPRPGSLRSLEERHAAGRTRFTTADKGKQTFTQAPKPRFRQIAYDSPPARCVYEIREGTPEARFDVWPLVNASGLVVALRDRAVDRLNTALPSEKATIEPVMIGRRPGGSKMGPRPARVRIVPLPSIGHHHADRGIRRVLVEVPGGCLLREGDVRWAFSGLEFRAPGDAAPLVLTTASAGDGMLQHYGVGDRSGHRVWRTVTPAALPLPTTRGRGRRPNASRAEELKTATGAVAQALRHAGVRGHAATIRLQREPFAARGERAADFAAGTRFAPKRMWHVEILFAEPVTGPLVIGDGRFLGLGVMAPVRVPSGVIVFAIDAGLQADAAPTEVARALRRAVMSRVQASLGPRHDLPTFFSGHDTEGAPARRQARAHLAFIFDPERRRLVILAPHSLQRRSPSAEERKHLSCLGDALAELRELRAGSAGRLSLRPATIDLASDPLFAPSKTWETVTRYQVTRHVKGTSAAAALAADITADCHRHGLPVPKVAVHHPRGVPGQGLFGWARLTFQVAVEGPIVLGRSRHLGGGVFVGGRQ